MPDNKPSEREPGPWAQQGLPKDHPVRHQEKSVSADKPGTPEASVSFTELRSAVCPRCEGNKFIPVQKKDVYAGSVSSEIIGSKNCPACRGTGKAATPKENK